MGGMNPVLAQKLGLSVPDEENLSPYSANRVMRRAFARAAQRSVGLAATVSDIVADHQEAEASVAQAPDGWVVIGLRDGSAPGLTGYLLIDPVLRAAIVELQTMGVMFAPRAEQRPVTRTDALMGLPFADAFLEQLQECGFHACGMDQASYELVVKQDMRLVGLVLAQGQYHSWRLTVDLGAQDVQGGLVLALRPLDLSAGQDEAVGQNWSENLRKSLEEAPAELDAILGHLTLSFQQAQSLSVGQVLPLPGTTVASVQLLGAGGVHTGSARLGRMAGRRAVRLENPQLHMEDGLGAADTGVAHLANPDEASGIIAPAMGELGLPDVDEPAAADPVSDLPDMGLDMGLDMEGMDLTAGDTEDPLAALSTPSDANDLPDLDALGDLDSLASLSTDDAESDPLADLSFDTTADVDLSLDLDVSAEEEDDPLAAFAPLTATPGDEG